MNTSREKAFGCLFLIGALVTALVVAVFLFDSAVGHITDYGIAKVQTDGLVAVAKLQAQDHITVSCMENSWFTSMRSCISAGGVNGVLGFSWPTIIVVSALSFVAALWWNKRGDAWSQAH